jgi:type IV secretion system protein VirD4
LSIAVAIGMSVWRAREAKTAATYGSARWATPSEIRAAGLTAPDGVVLGKCERDYAATSFIESLAESGVSAGCVGN